MAAPMPPEPPQIKTLPMMVAPILTAHIAPETEGRDCSGDMARFWLASSLQCDAAAFSSRTAAVSQVGNLAISFPLLNAKPGFAATLGVMLSPSAITLDQGAQGDAGLQFRGKQVDAADLAVQEQGGGTWVRSRSDPMARPMVRRVSISPALPKSNGVVCRSGAMAVSNICWISV